MGSRTPTKRPRSSSQASGPTKPPNKKTKTERKQQLISRFFGTTPSHAVQSAVTSVSQLESVPLTPSTALTSTQSSLSPDKTLIPLQSSPSNHEKKSDSGGQLQKSQFQLTETLTETLDDSDLHRSPSPPVTRRRTRPRLHKIIDLESDDDESPPRRLLSSLAASDPDFEVVSSAKAAHIPVDDMPEGEHDEEYNAEDDISHELELSGTEEPDVQVESLDSALEPNVSGESTKNWRSDSQSLTLTSYASSRSVSEASVAIPHDEKRRKRLINKVGRLEAGNVFRKNGGLNENADDSQGNAEHGGHGNGKGSVQKSRTTSNKYTPLEAQYVALRNAHPGLVLVVECGYKYRLFDQDASIASSVLRIAAYFDHNFLTASFPTHRLAHHVRRLVDAGHKVGVIAQAETAALKRAGDTSSKLFQRTLSAVYSKGTIVADGTLVASAAQTGPAPASYIMSVRDVVDPGDANSDRMGIALAAIDCATGEVLYDAFVDDVLRSDLDSRLVAIEPVELIVSDDFLSKRTNTVLSSFSESSCARLERLDNSHFTFCEDIADMNRAVEKTMPEKSLMCSGLLSCLGALVRYLKQFNLGSTMTSLTEYKSFRSRRQMKIGGDVLRNFEVFGNSNTGTMEGSLISLVNRTGTAFGSRQMRQWLSRPLVNSHDINSRLDAVTYLRSLVDGAKYVSHGSDIDNAVADLIISLGSVPDLEQGLTRISCGKSAPSDLVKVLTAVEMVGQKTDYIKSLEPGPNFPDLLKKLFEGTPVSSNILEDRIVHVLNKEAAMNDERHSLFGLDEPITTLDDTTESSNFLEAVAEVAEANEVLNSAEKAMSKLLRKYRNSYSNPNWEWKKVAQDEFLLEVPANKAASMPKSWTIVSQTKAVKRFRPDEAVSGYDRVLRGREILDAACTRSWDCYLKVFTPVASRLRALVRTLVDVDCLAALGRVANLPGYCRPTMLPNDKGGVPGYASIRAVDARHALSELLPSCKAYVPNDVILGGGESEAKAVVISGPNYGGKSSYARMTALLIMLAQIGSFVPAKAVEIRPFDAIFARMGAADCMAKGMSSLMVELAETARILHAASQRSLVVLDELGRGTSTHDGSAIAYATLAHLVGSVRCATLFVTHYPMIANLRHVFKGEVDACYMDYREDEDQSDATDWCRSTAISNDTMDAHHPTSNRRKKITLLYKLTRGVATSSYGVNVARLAGISPAVLDEALRQAVALEQKMGKAQQDRRFFSLLNADAWRFDDQLKKFLKTRKLLRN